VQIFNRLNGLVIKFLRLVRQHLLRRCIMWRLKSLGLQILFVLTFFHDRLEHILGVIISYLEQRRPLKSLCHFLLLNFKGWQLTQPIKSASFSNLLWGCFDISDLVRTSWLRIVDSIWLTLNIVESQVDRRRMRVTVYRNFMPSSRRTNILFSRAVLKLHHFIFPPEFDCCCFRLTPLLEFARVDIGKSVTV